MVLTAARLYKTSSRLGVTVIIKHSPVTSLLAGLWPFACSLCLGLALRTLVFLKYFPIGVRRCSGVFLKYFKREHSLCVGSCSDIADICLSVAHMSTRGIRS